MVAPNEIKALRKAAGLTQAQLGERIGGVAHSIIGKLENGKQDLTDDYLLKMCAALHCTPNDVFGFGKTVTNPPRINDSALSYAVEFTLLSIMDDDSSPTPHEIAETILDAYAKLVENDLIDMSEPARSIRLSQLMAVHRARERS